MAWSRHGRYRAALLRPLAEPARGASSGLTLVEVMVSILLTAIVVTAVMTVSLTARRGSVRTDRKLLASDSARGLLDRLANYISSSLEPGIGPNNGGWDLSGDLCDCCGGIPGCYALEPGTHTVTSLLPGEVIGPPYNMAMSYFVRDTEDAVDAGISRADFRPQVSVSVTWDEP